MSPIGKTLLGFHAWGGMLFSWLLIPVFVTGSVAVFEPEVTHWMQMASTSAQATATEAVALAEVRLREVGKEAPLWRIRLPTDREPLIGIGWGKNPRRMNEELLDAGSGEAIAVRETRGGHFFTHFHADLLLGPAGRWIVGAAGLVMLGALISGILIHHRFFSDFFTLRPRAGKRRTWLDVHNLAGISTLPFLLMITYTGCVILAETYMPAATQVLYEGNHRAIRADVIKNFERKASGIPGTSLPLASHLNPAEKQFGAGAISSLIVRNPGDRNSLVQVYRRVDDRISAVAEHITFDAISGDIFGQQRDWNPMAFAYRTQVGLHVVHFGGGTIRALYFLSGMLGAVMMATGTVLLLRKRRQQHGLDRRQRALEALGCASISGILFACSALLLANHLIPAELADRAEHEITAFFIAWALSLIHAWRRGDRAWREQYLLVTLILALSAVVDLASGGAFDSIRRHTDFVIGGFAVLTCLASRRFIHQEPPR